MFINSYIQNASNASGFGKDLSFVLQLMFNHQQGETLSNPFYTQVKSGKQTLDNTPPQFSIHVGNIQRANYIEATCKIRRCKNQMETKHCEEAGSNTSTRTRKYHPNNTSRFS